MSYPELGCKLEGDAPPQDIASKVSGFTRRSSLCSFDATGVLLPRNRGERLKMTTMSIIVGKFRALNLENLAGKCRALAQTTECLVSHLTSGPGPYGLQTQGRSEGCWMLQCVLGTVLSPSGASLHGILAANLRCSY